MASSRSGSNLIAIECPGNNSSKFSAKRAQAPPSLCRARSTLRSTELESPRAAAFLSAAGVRYGSTAGMPAKPGTYIQKGGESPAMSMLSLFVRTVSISRFEFFPRRTRTVVLGEPGGGGGGSGSAGRGAPSPPSPIGTTGTGRTGRGGITTAGGGVEANSTSMACSFTCRRLPPIASAMTSRRGAYISCSGAKVTLPFLLAPLCSKAD